MEYAENSRTNDANLPTLPRTVLFNSPIRALQRAVHMLKAFDGLTVFSDEMIAPFDVLYAQAHKQAKEWLKDLSSLSLPEDISDVVKAYQASVLPKILTLREPFFKRFLQDPTEVGGFTEQLRELESKLNYATLCNGVTPENYFWFDRLPENPDELLDYLRDLLRNEVLACDFRKRIVNERLFDKEIEKRVKELTAVSKKEEWKYFSQSDQQPQSTQWGKPLIFEKGNGRVVLRGKVLGSLKKWCRPYRFFEVLFDDADSVVSHEDIGRRLDIVRIDKTGNVASKMSKSIPDYLSDLKGKLPEEIRKLITPTKGGYMIDLREL